jgi:cytochrome P450
MYEAAVAGGPFHLLLHENLKVRAAAFEKLRPWTTVFEEPAEAVQAIDAFLRAKVTRERVMRPEGDDILTTLESIKAEKHKIPSKTIEFP